MSTIISIQTKNQWDPIKYRKHLQVKDLGVDQTEDNNKIHIQELRKPCNIIVIYCKNTLLLEIESQVKRFIEVYGSEKERKNVIIYCKQKIYTKQFLKQ